MWVYDPKAIRQTAPNGSTADGAQPAEMASAPAAVPKVLFSDDAAGAHTASAATSRPAANASEKEREIRHPAQKAQRQAIPLSLRLYLVLYACGLLTAGCLLQMASPTAQRFLRYYCSAWIQLLQSGHPLHLFSTLFLSGVLILTLLLFAGLCAFGAPLIYALLLAGGLGNGLLSLEFFLLYGCKGILLYIVLTGLSAAYLAQAMCFLAHYAMQNAGILFHCCASGAAGGTSAKPLQSRSLIGQYLFFCTLLILFCGTSAVLAQWIGRFLL